MTREHKPLEGIRVLNYGGAWPGRVASMLFADQGADVLEIEAPGREPRPEDALLGRGKRAITIDLVTEQGCAEALKLAHSADIVLDNLGPGRSLRFGLHHAVVSEGNPEVIYVSVPGFAAHSPEGDLPAWEGAICADDGGLHGYSHPWAGAWWAATVQCDPHGFRLWRRSRRDRSLDGVSPSYSMRTGTIRRSSTRRCGDVGDGAPDHGRGGATAALRSAAGRQGDLTPASRLFFYTITGWMMFNTLVSALLCGGSIVTYDGSPTAPEPDILWSLAAQTGATVFGASPTYVRSMEKLGIEPRQRYDLSALRMILLSGSPAQPETFSWFYAAVKRDLWIASTSGGTDICAANRRAPADAAGARGSDAVPGTRH
jgi:CoA-transferase family III/AMP-binding enzyme